MKSDIMMTANAVWTYFDGLSDLRAGRLQGIYSKYLGAFGKGYGKMPSWILEQSKTVTNDCCNTILYLVQFGE